MIAQTCWLGVLSSNLVMASYILIINGTVNMIIKYVHVKCVKDKYQNLNMNWLKVKEDVTNLR